MLRNQITQYIDKYGLLISLICFSSISLGLFSWEITHWTRLQAFSLNNAISSQEQTEILKSIVPFFLIVLPLSFGIAIKFPSDSIKTLLNTFLKLTSILFLIPFTLHKELWRTLPFTMIATITALSIYAFYIIKKVSIRYSLFYKEYSSTYKILSYLILFLLIVGYACYFSYYTIINHYNFGTATFDFGFYQNAFINTLHNHFMAISYNGNTSVFRDKCEFILLLYLPFFYSFPKAETLLILQSSVIALAALPLFLLSKTILKSTLAAIFIVLIFLLHPANHCANFYDIHQLSFLPLSIFLIFYCLEKKHTLGFILSILLLLTIKVDMFLLLIFLSLFIYFNNKNLKFSAYCLCASILYGILYVFVLKKWMYSFFFYYDGVMVNKSGGMEEILKTMITNPMYILNSVLTQDRILYFCQLFGPLIFIPLMRKKNLILFAYGLAITLLATANQGLHQIYFQYVWYIVPFLFISLIYIF